MFTQRLLAIFREFHTYELDDTAHKAQNLCVKTLVN